MLSARAEPQERLPGGIYPPRPQAMALEVQGLQKRFGAFAALGGVDLRVEPGEVHALLGENGAGKSTLVKCLAGLYQADGGVVLMDGREQAVHDPVRARALGIGMVHQHFTLAPGMTVAENLWLAAARQPAVIRWARERQALQDFLQRSPFQLALDARPAQLAAGEKQKLELLKQLLLQPRLLILDEPTSVLTPQEADEVLGHVRDLAHAGACSVLLITHKFREVQAYADRVTVLRRGRSVWSANAQQVQPQALAQAMVGESVPRSDLGAAPAPRSARRSLPDAVPALRIENLRVWGDRGTLAVQGLSLELAAGEILGLAGVSGNGQRELVEALVGQRPRAEGAVWVGGQPYHGRRAENHRLRLRALPEEPLRNACVGVMSLRDNLALRDFDAPPMSRGPWLRRGLWRRRAEAWIADYGIKTRGPDAPIESLSGGNVQRAVLARELDGDVAVLMAANAVFGLDFAAVADIHARLRALRDRGGAVLLISEDLDELLELSDRIVVISEGRLVHACDIAQADRHQLGAHMGGGHAPGTATEHKPR